MSDHQQSIRQGYSTFLRRWYNGLYADAPAIQSFKDRGIERSVMWAPGRMVDSAEEMLASYQKNENSTQQNASSLLPVVMVAMAKDYNPTTGDVAGRQVGRQLITLTEEPDASIYGYRQAAGDKRTQIVIVASEPAIADSLAAQLALFIGEVGGHNRRFTCPFTWGQYTLNMPCWIENPDIAFMNVQTERKNITMLAADVILRITLPYLDAPATGQPNDGSNHNPPGYPPVTEVQAIDQVVPWGVNVTEHAVVQFEPDSDQLIPPPLP